jgi:hypothetical protein
MRRFGEFLAELDPPYLGEVAMMGARDQLDAWLRYEGIVGYTNQIVEIMEELGWKRNRESS